MKKSAIDINKHNAVSAICIILITIKLSSYFSWSENVAITRVIKFGFKFLSSGSILWLYYELKKNYSIPFILKNPLPYIFYCAYLFIGALSFIWSSDTFDSIQQWIMVADALFFSWYLVHVMLLLIVYHQLAWDDILPTYFIIPITLHILVFVIGVFISPEIFIRECRAGEEARLGGFIMNPNELGMLCSLGLISIIFPFIKNTNRFLLILAAAPLLYAIILTGSRSSLVGFLLGIFILMQIKSSATIRIATVVVMAISAPYIFEKFILKNGDLEEVLSMTGRLPFWTALVTEGLPKEPLLGFGFMRISYTEFFSSVHTYSGKMTHNTFLQVLMNLGFTGFIIVLIQLINTFLVILKNKSIMILLILIPLLINSFTEFGIFGESNFGILFYQIIICALAISPRNYNPFFGKNSKKETNPMS